MNTKTIPVLHVNQDVMLPDNDQWQFRFEVHSETSDRVYTIAQHKTKRHWACSCPGWKAWRKCKHLRSIGLPSHEVPHEARIEGI